MYPFELLSPYMQLPTYFNTLYLLIYFSAVNLIIGKASVLLNYFNVLNLIVVKALDLLN